MATYWRQGFYFRQLQEIFLLATLFTDEVTWTIRDNDTQLHVAFRPRISPASVLYDPIFPIFYAVVFIKYQELQCHFGRI